MSDLLTRMITRATRPARGVMPILASRYETPSGGLGISEAFEEPSTPQPRIAVREQSEPSRTPFVSAHSDLAPARTEHRGNGTPAERTSARVDAVAAMHAQSNPTASAATPLAPPSPIFAVARREPADPVAPPHRPIPTTPESALPAVPEAPPIDFHPLATEHAIVRQPAAPPQQRLDEAPRNRRDAITRDPEPAPQQVEVHVSIGHIELRQAAPPAPPSKPRPAPAPHVRLEDYLKRRGGESR